MTLTATYSPEDHPSAPTRLVVPDWAKALIVAELEIDTSDSQSDYFASRTEKTVALAWSKHTKDLFAELRKVAATFPPTAQYGPGCDRYRAYVEQLDDVYSNGSFYGAGRISAWHNDLYGHKAQNFHGKHFYTREAAAAFITEAPPAHPISFEGTLVKFAWTIGRESVEHREKYSMGRGYYLGNDRYSGWQVRKICLPTGQIDATAPMWAWMVAKAEGIIA